MNLKLSFPLLAFTFLLINCSKSNYSSKEVNYIPYYLKVYEADSLYITGNYQRSFEILDSLFEDYEPLNQAGVYEMNTYVKSAYLTKNHKKIEPIFIQLFEIWGYKQEYLKYDSIMNLALEKTNLTTKNINSLIENYNEKVNRTLKDTLIEMHKLDQLYRGKDNDKKFRREDSVDFIHVDLLKYIFKKYGYPDARLVDQHFIGVEFNHISHVINEQDYQYFIDELKKFNKEGKSTQNQLTMLVDVREFKRNNRIIYGTFGTHESFGDKRIKFDTIEVNKNRKEIGFPSLQYEKFKYDYYERMYGIQ